MKRLVPMLCAGLALLLALPAVLAVCGFVLPAQYADTFLGELPHKVTRLTETDDSRIIVIGGSAVPFSLKSGLLEEALPGWQVVDFGLYADMGMVIMLDLARDAVRAGDIVLLSPEQSAQTLSCRFSGEDVWQAVDGAFGLLERLDPARAEGLAAAFPAFAGKKLRYALTGGPAAEGVYARSAFDGYGDIACAGRERNILPGGYDSTSPISFAADLMEEDFAAALNDFAQAAEQKGAQVLYHFPPMNRAALAEGTSAGDIDAYYDALQSRLTFAILGDPHRSVMDSGWFFDTNYHLNDSGAVVYTKHLAEDLKTLLRDTSPTALALPAMPAPAAMQGKAGDDSCADCFTYRREGSGWVLDGLTAKGREAEDLTVPASWQGEGVTGLTAGLFTDCPRLGRVTLPAVPLVLPDGLFSGCSSLRTLVLSSADPACCTVGQGLRAGADFFIEVPAAALDRYRRHYSWQKYDAYLVAGKE